MAIKLPKWLPYDKLRHLIAGAMCLILWPFFGIEASILAAFVIAIGKEFIDTYYQIDKGNTFYFWKWKKLEKKNSRNFDWLDVLATIAAPVITWIIRFLFLFFTVTGFSQVIDCSTTSFGEATDIRVTIDWSDCCEPEIIDGLGNTVIFPEGLSYGSFFPNTPTDLFSTFPAPVSSGSISITYQLVEQDPINIAENEEEKLWCEEALIEWEENGSIGDPPCDLNDYDEFDDFGCFTFIIDNPNNLSNIQYSVEVKTLNNDWVTVVEVLNLEGREEVSFEVFKEQLTAPPTQGFRVYPVPTKDILYLKNAGTRHEVYDAKGMLVATSTTQWIDISLLNRGVYFVKTYGDKITASKFIKK